MTQRRMLANASFRLSEREVTHRTARDGQTMLRACSGCGREFRPKRTWQKQCSPRCRQRAYVKRGPIRTYGYYGA